MPGHDGRPLGSSQRAGSAQARRSRRNYQPRYEPPRYKTTHQRYKTYPHRYLINHDAHRSDSLDRFDRDLSNFLLTQIGVAQRPAGQSLPSLIVTPSTSIAFSVPRVAVLTVTYRVSKLSGLLGPDILSSGVIIAVHDLNQGMTDDKRLASWEIQVRLKRYDELLRRIIKEKRSRTKRL